MGNIGTSKDHGKLGMPKANLHILVFNNCIYDLRTKTKKNFDPPYLVFSQTPFDYTDIEDKPNFDEYLNDFCEGYPDRTMFLTCFLYMYYITN